MINNSAVPKSILNIFVSILTQSPFFFLGYRFIDVKIKPKEKAPVCYMEGKTLYINSDESHFGPEGITKEFFGDVLLLLLTNFYCFMLGLVTSQNRSNIGLSHFCKFLVSYLQLVSWSGNTSIFDVLKIQKLSLFNTNTDKPLDYADRCTLCYNNDVLTVNFDLKALRIPEPKSKTWQELYDILLPELPPDLKLPEIYSAGGGGDGDVDSEGQETYEKLQRTLHSQQDLIRGHHPGSATDFLAPEIEEEKIDWRSVLGSIVYDIIDGGLEQRWEPFKWHNPYSPSLVRRVDSSRYLGDIVVAIDTSGSMSHEDLNNAISEIFHLLAQRVSFTLTLIQCDATIQDVKVYESDLKPSIDAILEGGIKGRGGTSTIPVFNYCEENNIDVKALFYLTDMGIDYPQNPPDYADKVYWFNTNKHHQKVSVPFGQIFDCF